MQNLAGLGTDGGRVGKTSLAEARAYRYLTAWAATTAGRER